MKIQSRLMWVILPTVLVIYLISSVITGVISTKTLKDQTQKNAQLLSYSYSTQLSGQVEQYLNIAQDLGSAVITSIHIETTLKSFRRRYPQFSHVFYMPADGKVLEMAPYSPEYLDYDFSAFEAWKQVHDKQSPTISKAGIFFNDQEIIFFAPAILSYVFNQDPTVEGYIALVIPLKVFFRGIASIPLDEEEHLYVLNQQGEFLYLDNEDFLLSSSLNTLSMKDSLDNVILAMSRQKSGFALYDTEKITNYLSFSPIVKVNWSLAIGGNYKEISSQIRTLSMTNFLVVFMGLILGMLVLYRIVHTVIKPIEELTVITQKIAQGDKTLTSNIQSTSELGILSKSINSMVGQLRDYHRDLEIKVEERTLELHRSNEELESTVEELNSANDSLNRGRTLLEERVQQRTEDLNRANIYIKNIIDSMPSIIIGIDMDGKINQWNFEAEKRLGLSLDKALNQPLSQVLPHFSEYMDEIMMDLQNKNDWTYPQFKRKFQDQWIFEDICIYPLTAPGITGGVIRIDDTTDRIHLEESLRQSQRMESIGQLAGGVAHDFNNMLGGILGGCDLLEDYIEKESEANIYLSMITESANHAATLTGKLLSFARKGGSQKNETVDINKSLLDTVSLLENSVDKNIKIETTLNAKECNILGNFTEIHNLFLNLGINGAQAMEHKGGQLSFLCSNVSLDRKYCENSAFNIIPGEYIRIIISDTGKGIKPEIQSKIFDPFFTTKEQGKGTGLGLSTVYATIKESHGDINLQSNEGKGSTFTIHFPLSDQIKVRSKKSESIIKGTGTILLVDDEPVIRKSVQAMLERIGYSVLVADDGVTGLETFETNINNIDLVILDMIMPRMNGKECFEKIKEISPKIPIIMASGFANEKDVDELFKMGLLHFIQKPYSLESLSQVLSDSLL